MVVNLALMKDNSRGNPTPSNSYRREDVRQLICIEDAGGLTGVATLLDDIGISM